MREKNLILKGLTVVGLWLMASAAYASEGRGHHGSPLLALIPYWVNFVAYIVLMYFLTRKAIGNAWHNRRTVIEDFVYRAEKELREINIKLDEMKAKLEQVETEMDRVREEIAKETEIESEAIRQDTKHRAELIIKRAHETLVGERTAAEKELRAEIADKIVERASELLRQSVTSETDYGRRQKSLEGISGMIE